MLALALKQMLLVIAYAIWSGLGTVAGVLLIVAGVVVLNVFPGASAH